MDGRVALYGGDPHVVSLQVSGLSIVRCNIRALRHALSRHRVWGLPGIALSDFPQWRRRTSLRRWKHVAMPDGWHFGRGWLLGLARKHGKHGNVSGRSQAFEEIVVARVGAAYTCYFEDHCPCCEKRSL